MIRNSILFLVAFITLQSCSVEPQPISYGADGCDFCKMNIVEQQYGSELVSEKGKVFKFDATECMLNFKLQNTTANWAFEMVTDYDTPEKLINANGSFVLRSKKLPSPMGAYLTSTASKEAALKLQEKFGGTIYSYAELSEKFKQLPKW